MMRKVLLPFGLFLLLAAGESAAARWLPSPFAVPVLLPTLLTLAFRLPARRLTRLVMLGGLAGEVTSGLPMGTVFLGLVGIPLIVRGLVRRQDLPIFLYGLIGALATLAFLVFVHASAPGPLLPPQRFLGQFLTVDIVFPALFSGALVLVWSAFLVAVEERRALPLVSLFSERAGTPRPRVR